jgi:hypothetical protein
MGTFLARSDDPGAGSDRLAIFSEGRSHETVFDFHGRGHRGAIFGATTFSARSAGDEDAILEGKLPPGCRDWRLISVAHEEAISMI